MSPPRAAKVSAWHCVLLEKSPGWGIGLGGISCSIYCRVLHSAILALSLARIRREFAFAEYGYLQPMQELFASRRKISRCASFCRIFFSAGNARLILEVGIRRLEISARPNSRLGEGRWFWGTNLGQSSARITEDLRGFWLRVSLEPHRPISCAALVSGRSTLACACPFLSVLLFFAFGRRSASCLSAWL